MSSKVRTRKLIELYDEVMGVKVYQRGKGRPLQSDDERLENRFVSSVSRLDWIPFLSEGIYRYDHQWNGEYIHFGEWLAESRDIRYFNCPKVVLREIVNPRPFATFVQEPTVIKNTAAVFISKASGYSLYYLLGLLNSTLFKSIIFEKASKRDNTTYPSFTSNLLKALPIAEISFTTPKKTREKLTKTMVAQSEKALSMNESDEEVKQKLEPVIQLAREYGAEKNDVLQDFLSNLAEQMLAMNKEKQAFVNGFFTWMGHYGVPPRHELKPKRKFDEFWKLEFKALLALLKKKVSLPTSTQNDLLDRFTSASEELNALDKRIRNTDWLIDMVVYALYGLTDEEIQLVERA
jgi:hypothetical protein